MATLNTIQLHVESESPSYKVDIPTHPVENGVDVSDHIKPQAVTFSIDGIINGDDHEDRKKRIVDAMNRGAILYYNGVHKMGNVLIESFSPDYSKDIRNGFAFSMNLVEVRIVKAKTVAVVAAKPVSNTGRKQVAKATTGEKWVTIKKGDTLSAYAKAYGTSVAALKKLNPSVVPTKMVIGSKVRVK